MIPLRPLDPGTDCPEIRASQTAGTGRQFAAVRPVVVEHGSLSSALANFGEWEAWAERRVTKRPDGLLWNCSDTMPGIDAQHLEGMLCDPEASARAARAMKHADRSCPRPRRLLPGAAGYGRGRHPYGMGTVERKDLTTRTEEPKLRRRQAARPTGSVMEQGEGHGMQRAPCPR